MGARWVIVLDFPQDGPSPRKGTSVDDPPAFVRDNPLIMGIGVASGGLGGRLGSFTPHNISPIGLAVVTTLGETKQNNMVSPSFDP